jgi:hypothetical protein
VLIFDDKVSTGYFDNSTFTVTAGEIRRSVANAYVSDEAGVRANSGAAIAIELKTGYADGAGPIENSSVIAPNVLTVARSAVRPGLPKGRIEPQVRA